MRDDQYAKEEKCTQVWLSVKMKMLKLLYKVETRTIYAFFSKGPTLSENLDAPKLKRDGFQPSNGT